jgi:hypothetical protein
LREEIKQERALRLTLIAKMEEDRPALFGLIWGLLPRESEEMVMQHAAEHVLTMAIETRDDPFLLCARQDMCAACGMVGSERKPSEMD